ncbi:MAG: hypothetical protein GWO00_20260, partial [Gemmatimonadetes bacterium]|nr:hypothetical protein [Gemmatimonadota bacterium]NIT89367.1 hypothetical protein [Gemmatimonadota bacterium]NIU33173.1 hypothetical protein [Gemmatimonadota bacterium]NIV63524.1 hypothetical protein [Gemmatimonadota bacterium]NIW66240.1 hypothetical protein [Gemmatimonadota bacterium]
MLQEIARNRERWSLVGPDSYTYGLERHCFCGALARGPVRVTVVDGEVTARVYVETGEPVPEF